MFTTRNIVCTALLTAFIAGMNWALVALSKAMEFSSFMMFGICLIATMIAGGYVWDWLSARSVPRRETDHP